MPIYTEYGRQWAIDKNAADLVEIKERMKPILEAEEDRRMTSNMDIIRDAKKAGLDEEGIGLLTNALLDDNRGIAREILEGLASPEQREELGLEPVPQKIVSVDEFTVLRETKEPDVEPEWEDKTQKQKWAELQDYKDNVIDPTLPGYKPSVNVEELATSLPALQEEDKELALQRKAATTIKEQKEISRLQWANLEAQRANLAAQRKAGVK